MGFAADTLKGVNGIQYFYIIGLLIFIALFIVIIYRTLKMSGNDLIKYKRSIIEEDIIEPNDI